MDEKLIEQEFDNARKAKEAAELDDVLVVETDVPGAVVAAFRVPTAEEWKRYRCEGMADDVTVKEGAGRKLVLSACIYPPRAIIEAAVQSHPGLVQTFGNELIPHAGAGRAKKVSKL
jgi:hypothetical protein